VKKIQVRPANISDAIVLAKIHQMEISSGFLSSLHITVLVQLYKHVSKKGILIVAETEAHTVAGFIACVPSLKKFYLSFLINKIFIITPYILKEMLSPRRLQKIFETVLLPFKKQTAKKPLNEKEQALGKLPELISIAVSKKFQKEGVGKILLDGLEHELKKSGLNSYRVVAGESLSGANKFYLKNGFHLQSKIQVHQNEYSNLYIKEIQTRCSIKSN